MRDKIARYENELVQRKEENTKLKNKVNNLKHQVTKLELTEKKLRNLLTNRDHISNTSSLLHSTILTKSVSNLRASVVGGSRHKCKTKSIDGSTT